MYIYRIMENLIVYLDEQDHRGNLESKARYIISKTGAPGKLFKWVKYHLFDERNTEIEEILF